MTLIMIQCLETEKDLLCFDPVVLYHRSTVQISNTSDRILVLSTSKSNLSRNPKTRTEHPFLRRNIPHLPD